MNLKRWGAVATLAIAVSIFASGCGRVNLFAGPSPTSPPTRTPYPTFTPRPQVTDTPVATEVPTEAATEVPTDTAVPPTRRAVPTARPKPPTERPAPTGLPPTAGPTTDPFTYHFFPATCDPGADPAGCNAQGGVHCEHSALHQIKVIVYSNFRDPGSVLAGVKVRFSSSPGGSKIEPDETTGGDGLATKGLSANGDSPLKNVGTYFAWVIGPGGVQLSDYSPPIVINGKNENDPQTCWIGTVAFAGGQ
jgi:hypothetical protein